jgi:hypothetical protein
MIKSRTTSRGPCRAGTAVIVLGPLIIGFGCIVSPPEPQEVWNAWEEGLSSPLGTIEAFRTSLRGEILAAEYRCFSSAWKSRMGISQVGYREYRDSLLAQTPHLIWALSRASMRLEEGRGPNRATVLATFDGPWIDFSVRFQLLREAYMEVRAAGRRVVSEPLDQAAAQVRHDPDQGLLFAWIPVQDLSPGQEVESFRLETEWRIDAIDLATGNE